MKLLLNILLKTSVFFISMPIAFTFALEQQKDSQNVESIETLSSQTYLEDCGLACAAGDAYPILRYSQCSMSKGLGVTSKYICTNKKKHTSFITRNSKLSYRECPNPYVYFSGVPKEIYLNEKIKDAESLFTGVCVDLKRAQVFALLKPNQCPEGFDSSARGADVVICKRKTAASNPVTGTPAAVKKTSGGATD
jgi:hypothetical protein